MSRILLVDDEGAVLPALVDLLRSEGHEVVTARRATEALDRLAAEDFELVILDVRLPGISGLDALERIKQVRPKLPVIVMTGQGTMETAVEATKRGAFDYHLKPFEPAEMLETIERALEGARLMRGQVAVGSANPAGAEDAIIGQSPGMQQVFKAIGRVAQTDATVLIRGESGTGKELVARAIYQHSLRSDAPLLVVNCVAIPETLLESELFGYEKGAFTGATARRIGKLEQASGGTIFLDEIGDVPPSIQAKILRVLQEREFERLGGNETIRTDVRVLSATNRDLEIAIAEGDFRGDLYHRLDVVTIHVPPLRERREDFPFLVDYFLERFARELKTDRPPLSEGVMEVLLDYAWPGNVRELQHCIQRAVIYSRGHPLQVDDLPLAVGRGRRGTRAGPAPPMAREDEKLLDLVRRHLDSRSGDRAHERLLAQVEKALLAEALRRTQGNQTRAAKLLGLARPTLHAKIRKYGLHEPDGPRER